MILIQPKQQALDEYKEIAEKNHYGFEIMDFAFCNVLDNAQKLEEIQKSYVGSNTYSCHGVFSDINYSGSDPCIYQISEKRIRQSIEAACEIGIKKFVFHTCFHNVLLPTDPLYRVWSKNFAKLFCKIADEYGVDIFLENVLDISPDVMIMMLEEANHPKIKVCLDIGHANLSKTPMTEWFEKLHTYIKYIHLSDNHGIYDEHLPIGEGSIDWKLFEKMILKYNVKADYTLEINTMDGINQFVALQKGKWKWLI